MALPEFDYVLVKSLDEASDLMAKEGSNAILMAGGTDVIILVKEEKLAGLKKVVDLKAVPGMDQLEYVEGDGLKIGALTKLFAIQTSEIVQEKLPAVAQAAHYVASAQIRRKGTMAGNVCNASPSADTVPILIAMDAKVKAYSKIGGAREIPMSQFYTGFRQTALDKSKGEIMTEIDIPELKSQEGSAYLKCSVRKAMDLAIIGVAAWVKMDGSKVADCRIAMGGVGITALRAPKAEKLFIGKEITEDVLEEVGMMASTECHPISDVRASAEYRTDMIRVFTKRAIKQAVETLKA